MPTLEELVAGIITLAGLCGMAAVIYMAFDAILRPPGSRLRVRRPVADLRSRSPRHRAWGATVHPNGLGWTPADVARLLIARGRRAALQDSEHRLESQ